MFKRIFTCYSYANYTRKHIKALKNWERKYFGKVLHPYHDLDKMFMYTLLPFLGEKKINEIHQKHNRHHLTYWENDKEIFKPIEEVDFLEGMVDYEVAPITKPDKPRRAREFIVKFYPEYLKYYEPYLNHFNL